jgi:pimeloyl-ACP methyl ester carboxylesterase
VSTSSHIAIAASALTQAALVRLGIRTEGRGPDLVFVHGTGGSGSDIPVPLLREWLRVTTYDRRGIASQPIAPGSRAPTVEEHAGDLCAVIESTATRPVTVCGTSFGGLVALELARRRPDLVRNLAVFEPPIGYGGDEARPDTSRAFSEFDEFVARGEPERAAELFHRRAIGDERWVQLPEEVRQRLVAKWPKILADLFARAAYRLDHHELTAIATPVLLLHGARSRPLFEAAVRMLGRTLPRARVVTLASAGHCLNAQGWAEVTAALHRFLVAVHHD